MTYKKIKSLLFCLLFANCAIMNGLEVPLFLRWKSINTGAYCPNQTGKEIHWNEFYQIGMGIDSLAYKDLFATMELRSRANFIENHIEIYKFDLSWAKNNWEITAGSIPWGYGLPNKLYSFAHVSADEDQYSYQATRLNRVYLGYNFADNKIAIDVGGDNHNQVTGKLTYQRQMPFGYFQATEEIRAQDNHWQTPVSISSVNTQRQKGDLVLEAQLAFSFLPNYDVTEKHTTTYALLAGKYKINDLTELFGSGEYLELEPTLMSYQQYRIAFSRKISVYSLNPFYYLDYYDKSTFHRIGLSWDWHFCQTQRIGLIYYMEGSKLNKAKHNLGIQANLELGL